MNSVSVRADNNFDFYKFLIFLEENCFQNWAADLNFNCKKVDLSSDTESCTTCKLLLKFDSTDDVSLTTFRL